MIIGGSIMGLMSYIVSYQDPWDRNGISEDGTVVTHTITLRIGSNTALTDERVRKVLRLHLREIFKITEIEEEKIRIE